MQKPHWSACVVAEGRLERGQLAVRREPFDRPHLGPVELDGKQEAGANGRPVHPHRARAADAVLAADVRAGEPERVPEEVGGEQARLDHLAVAAAVDGDFDRGHAASSQARSTARSASTPVTWRR